MSQIKNWRQKIDEIDDKIISLLSARRHCSLRIGELKKANKTEI